MSASFVIRTRRFLRSELRQVLAAVFLGYLLSCLSYLAINQWLDTALQDKFAPLIAGTNRPDVLDPVRDLAKAAGQPIVQVRNAILYGAGSCSRWLDEGPIGMPWRLALPFIWKPQQTIKDVTDALTRNNQKAEGAILEVGSRFAGQALDQLRTSGYYKVRRYLNGPIQFATFWLGFAGLVLVLGQAIAVRRDTAVLKSGSLFPTKMGPFGPGSDELLEYETALQDLHTNLSRAELPTALPDRLSGILMAYSRTGSVEEANQRLEDGVDLMRSDLESSSAIIRYIAWAVPAVGFIGTVVGIGDALAEAHTVIKAGTEAVKQSSIQSITSMLSVAFDTTLVALLWSLVLMAFLHSLERAEDKVLNTFHDRAKSDVVDRLDSQGLERQFRKLLEKQAGELVQIMERQWLAWERKRLSDQSRFLEFLAEKSGEER